MKRNIFSIGGHTQFKLFYQGSTGMLEIETGQKSILVKNFICDVKTTSRRSNKNPFCYIVGRLKRIMLVDEVQHTGRIIGELKADNWENDPIAKEYRITFDLSKNQLYIHYDGRDSKIDNFVSGVRIRSFWQKKSPRYFIGGHYMNIDIINGVAYID